MCFAAVAEVELFWVRLRFGMLRLLHLLLHLLLLLIQLLLRR